MIKVYLKVFIYLEQNNWAKLLPIVEFVYNNAKNISTGYILLKFNYKFHLQVLFKKDNDSQLQFRLANKLSNKLKELINFFYQNLLYI